MPSGIVVLAPHVLRPRGVGIEPGGERETCWRANRCRGEGVGVDHSGCGQLVEVRRYGVFIAVASEEWAVVLANQPENVGAPGLSWS